MTVVQAWLLLGVPGLIVVAALFVGRSRIRAWVGYGVLIALVAAFLTVDGGSIWAGLIGLVTVGLVATGRGSQQRDDGPEHHETRARYTHAA